MARKYYGSIGRKSRMDLQTCEDADDCKTSCCRPRGGKGGPLGPPGRGGGRGPPGKGRYLQKYGGRGGRPSFMEDKDKYCLPDLACQAGGSKGGWKSWGIISAVLIVCLVGGLIAMYCYF